MERDYERDYAIYGRVYWNHYGNKWNGPLSQDSSHSAVGQS